MMREDGNIFRGIFWGLMISGVCWVLLALLFRAFFGGIAL
jgi:hypothetical protein